MGLDGYGVVSEGNWKKLNSVWTSNFYTSDGRYCDEAIVAMTLAATQSALAKVEAMIKNSIMAKDVISSKK
jgi:hypothetical protein